MFTKDEKTALAIITRTKSLRDCEAIRASDERANQEIDAWIEQATTQLPALKAQQAQQRAQIESGLAAHLAQVNEVAETEALLARLKEARATQ